MVLTNCRECGKAISEKATTCPHCGATTDFGKQELRKKKRNLRGNVQGAGCLMLILGIILGFLFGPIVASFLIAIGIVVLIVGLFL